MAAATHRITRCDCLVAFAGFVIGLISFAALRVAHRHIHGIEAMAERFGAVHASYESPSLNGRQLFPPDDPWNTDISREPVDPNSNVLIASIGANKSLHPDFETSYNGQLWGVPNVVVPENQAQGTSQVYVCRRVGSRPIPDSTELPD